MHFQVPPADLVKTVCCATGRVLDVVVDLRVGSPTYGQHEAFILDAAAPEIVYIPAGLAHGFLVLSTESLMLYQVTHDYAPKSDSGIRWDSCGIAWGVTNPVVSERDDALPRLADFASPFRYSGQS